MTWLEIIRDIMFAGTLFLFLIWLATFAPDSPPDADDEETQWWRAIK